MAIYTKSEVATLTGKSKAHVSMNIKRGKLIVSVDENDDEWIDTSVGDNSATIKKWTDQEIAKKTVVIVSEPEPEKIEIKKPKSKAKEPTKKTARKLEPKVLPVSSSDNLETQKKLADIENKIATTERTKLQSAKLRGESIPTNMVMSVISVLGAGFQLSYKSGAENLMMNFNHKYKLPPKAVSELKLKLIELINDSHAEGIGIAKDTINKILADNASAEANKD